MIQCSQENNNDSHFRSDQAAVKTETLENALTFKDFICPTVEHYVQDPNWPYSQSAKFTSDLNCSTSLWSIRCRSRQIFRDAKDFCPNFPLRARKVFVRLFITNFVSHRSWRPFWCNLQTRVFMRFLVLEKRIQTLGAIFARIFRDFARTFDKAKLLGVRLHPRLLHHWPELILCVIYADT